MESKSLASKKQKSVRVLIAGDDTKNLELVKSSLNNINSIPVRIKTADSIQKVTTLLKGVRFDAIFVDLELKENCEGALIELVDKNACKAPLIVLSEQQEERHIQEVITRFNVYDYLIKSEISDGIIRRSLMYALAKRQAELDNRRLEAELRHSQKVEMIGQLSGGIAHDFNNKLTIFAGNIFTAKAMLGKDHPAIEFLNCAQKAVKSAAGLTKKILDFSRKTERDAELIDINETIGNSVEVLAGVVGHDIDMQFIAPTERFTLILCPTHLDQVVMNLVINARDSISHRNGKITIGTSLVRKEENGEEFYCLKVEDNGAGMSKATVQHIFEPFYTTKDASKGTGLGLAVINRLVTEQGGYIDVTSEIDKGTTFKVFFRIHEETLELVA